MKTDKLRILVVDDLPSDTSLLKRYLEGTQRYTVREVNDAQLAAAVAEEFQPDLIMLDVRMPDLSGGEVASTIEANPQLIGVPIVFLTAAVSKAEVAAVRGRIGKYPFLAKPIVLTEVEDCLRQILGNGPNLGDLLTASPQPKISV